MRSWRGSADEFFEGWWSQEVFASHRWSVDFRRALVERRRVVDFHSAADELDEWGQGRRNLWPVVESLELPILAIAGSHDPKYACLAREIARRTPNGRFCLIQNAGHMVHLEAPEALAAAVGDFLAEISDHSA